MKKKIAIITGSMLIATNIFSGNMISSATTQTQKVEVSDEVISNNVIKTTTKEVSPEKLAEMITDLKSRITIDDIGATFKYTVNVERGINLYNFMWESEESSVYIKYGEDKNVYEYYSYPKNIINQDGIKKLPTYSAEQAKKIASEFLSKALQDEYKNFKFKSNSGNINSNIYSFEFDYYKNNVIVDGMWTNISVDAGTGKIINYSTSLNNNVRYDGISEIIDVKKAQEAFKTQLGIKKIYQSEYENDGSKIKGTKIIYVPNYSSQYVIDAKTGKRLDLYSNGSMNQRPELEGSDQATSDKNSVPVLTEQEIKEIESKANLKSLKEVQTALEKIGIEGFDINSKLQTAQLYESGYSSSSGYIWSLSYYNEATSSRFTAQLDAKNLELISFSSYNYQNSDNTVEKTQVNNAVTEANKAVNKYSKINDSNLKLDEINLNQQIGNKSPYIYVQYSRVENGIEYPENYVNITYSAITGKISSYYKNWYEVEFVQSENLVSPESILNKIFDENKIELKYKIITSGNGTKIEGRLIYEIDQNDSAKPLIFDATTGMRIVAENTDEKVASNYTDISSSPYKKELNSLLQLGIGFSGDKLLPSKVIKQNELLYLISQTFEYTPRPLYEISNMTILERKNIEDKLRSKGVLLENEKMTDQEITREEAVKYLVRALGYEKIASKPELFNSSLLDFEITEENLKGYVAIGDALNIITKDSSGKFNPKEKATRQDSLKMIYNYLK